MELSDHILIGRTGFSINRFDWGVWEDRGARRTMEDKSVVIQVKDVYLVSVPSSFILVQLRGLPAGTPQSLILSSVLFLLRRDEINISGAARRSKWNLPCPHAEFVVRQLGLTLRGVAKTKAVCSSL